MDVQTWTEVRRLRAAGTSIKAIVRDTGLSRNTVRRALAESEVPVDGRRDRGSRADPYEDAIARILARDPSIAATEMARQLGWPFSMTLLRERLHRLRDHDLRAPVKADPQRLPAETTSFVARREELAAIKSLLGHTRLLTLTGPGGIGKTRLALKAGERFARAFPGGVWHVSLAALRNPDLLARTFVQQLGLAYHDGVATDPEELLRAHFRHLHALLIVDNCEHLVEPAGALIASLAIGAPHLRVMSTSRQALGLNGEQLFCVPPLAFEAGERPSAGDDAALVLFAERASAVVADFAVTDETTEVVRRICRQLDGVPLGIELAAVQLRVLSIRELEQQFAERMLSLRDGPAARAGRHDSLDAAIEWSYELCSDDEQLLWARASVFASGGALDAIQRVCDVDGLSGAGVLEAIRGLVAKSILRREEVGGAVRFRMLEPLREFGRGHLSAPELADAQRRHLAWCVDLISRLGREWWGPDQRDWHRRVRAEQANLRAALGYAVGPGGDPVSAQRIVSDAPFLWAILSLNEHQHWLEEVRRLPGGQTRALARCLTTQGMVLTLQGDRQTARARLARSRAIADRLADPLLDAYNLHQRGLADFFAGDLDSAQARLGAARDRYAALGAPDDLTGSLAVQNGMLGVFTGRLGAAESGLRDVLGRARAVGERWLSAYAEAGLGLVALAREDPAEAVRRTHVAMAVLGSFADATGVGLCLDLLAWSESLLDHAERAAVLMGAASAMWQSFGRQLYDSEQFIAEREGSTARAVGSLGAARFEQSFTRGTAMTRAEVIDFALGTSAADADPPATWEQDLTPREREIARLVARGLTNREIGIELVVSHRTVEGHVSHALRKLGLTRRAQLANLVPAAGAALV